MLHFLAADIEEQQGNIAPAKQVYVDLVGNPGVNADAEDAEPKVSPPHLCLCLWQGYLACPCAFTTHAALFDILAWGLKS